MELITNKDAYKLWLKNRYKMEKEYISICSTNRIAEMEIRNTIKKSGFRLIARIPLSAVTIHGETKKYFDPEQDSHERLKDSESFLKRFPEFRVKP